MTFFASSASCSCWFSLRKGAILSTIAEKLRWLEIALISRRQIIFQMQFGLSYKCEICHRNKSNVIESLHYIFPTQGTCYHGNYVTHSVAPPNSKAVVLLREQVGEIFSNLLFLFYYYLQNYLQRYTIHYITYTICTTYNTVLYYVFFDFYTHTTRIKEERNKRKGKGRTTYYICASVTYKNNIKATKILVLVDLLTFKPLK